jgi:Flp pilus assembly pilin Flp
MVTMLKRLMRDESGQDFAEYGIALAVIAGVAVLIAVAIGQDVQTLWQRGQNAVDQVVNP